MSRTLFRRRLAVVLLALGALLLAGVPADAAINHDAIQGSGSSWSANAVNQWVADVKASGLRVVYTYPGSAQGRKDFASYNSDYGVSDIGYQGSDPKTGADDSSSRPYAYLPIVGGGTAFPYQIKVGGKPVTNLRLSGETLAKIFTGKISNWNDDAITKDNNGRKLPTKPIIPLVHSEGAGSTAQFTSYLASMFPTLWTEFNDGSPAMTEYYPRKYSAVAQAGSDGVMNYIRSASGDGTIGYDEYSYPLAAGYPVAKIKNAAGFYSLPTQYNDAVALTQAEINMDKNSKDYLLQKLDKVYRYSDPRTYPLSSYSYAIIPIGNPDRRMTTPKRQTLADFLFYSVCGGQAEMGPIGYSPLPLNLVQASFAQIAKLRAADNAVDISTQNPKNCSNPTFDGNNPAKNHLAEIAPQPAACDAEGQGPCGDRTNSGRSNGGAGSGNGAAGGSATGSAGGTGTGTRSGTGAATGSGAASKAATKINPDTGQVETAATGDGSGPDIVASPIDLASYQRAGSNTPFAVLAVTLLGLALVTPPLLTRRLADRKGKR
jgi:phosphate transport system substrate-binding protein